MIHCIYCYYFIYFDLWNNIINQHLSITKYRCCVFYWIIRNFIFIVLFSQFFLFIINLWTVYLNRCCHLTLSKHWILTPRSYSFSTSETIIYLKTKGCFEYFFLKTFCRSILSGRYKKTTSDTLLYDFTVTICIKSSG